MMVNGASVFVELIDNTIFMQTAGGTILSSPLFINAILPFILIFTIIFAILQKSEILGKGTRQIDAIVGAVIALIVISFANAVGIIVSLMPFLAVSAVIILVFLILYAMVYKEGTFEIHKGLRIAFGIIIGLAVIIAVLISTGGWDYIRYELLAGGDNSTLIANIVFLIIAIVAIVIVVVPGKKKEDK